MATRDFIEEAMRREASKGNVWLRAGEIISATLALDSAINPATVQNQLRFHCINDPTKNYNSSKAYLRIPLLLTDNPQGRGRRFRLLSDKEVRAFLANPREDLENASYRAVEDWLADSSTELDVAEPEDDEPELAEDTFSFILESHLQDYVFQHWPSCFPDLVLVDGGKEFHTSEPSVGVLDFLCRDRQGNYVVIETKRWSGHRTAVGQILSYMAWVKKRLCSADESVRGILVVAEADEAFRLAVSAVPNLEVQQYEITFRLKSVES